MCGIIGFVGNEPAAPILLDGLERMEYRGYDSAGVAVRSETAGLQVRKTKGRLQVLIRPDPRRRGPGGEPGHRAYPLGHPRGAQRHQRPSPRQRERADRPRPQRHHRKLSGAQGAPHAPGRHTSPPTRTRRWWHSCWSSTTTNATTCWRPWAAACGGSRGPTPSASSARTTPTPSLPPGRTAP